MPSGAAAAAKVAAAKEKADLYCDTRAEQDLIFDCDASSAFASKPSLVCPTLLASRSAGLWLLTRGRRLSAQETLRLQGLADGAYLPVGSDNQMRRRAGNAMSCNVLQRLLYALFLSIGRRLASVDPWVSGQAPLRLTTHHDLAQLLPLVDARCLCFSSTTLVAPGNAI